MKIHENQRISIENQSILIEIEGIYPPPGRSPRSLEVRHGPPPPPLQWSGYHTIVWGGAPWKGQSRPMCLRLSLNMVFHPKCIQK